MLKKQNQWKNKVVQGFSKNLRCNFKSIQKDQFKMFIAQNDFWFKAVHLQLMCFLDSCIEVDAEYFFHLKEKNSNALYYFCQKNLDNDGADDGEVLLFVSWYYRYCIQPIVIDNGTYLSLFQFLLDQKHFSLTGMKLIHKMMLDFNDKQANNPKNFRLLQYSFSRMEFTEQLKYLQKVIKNKGESFLINLIPSKFRKMLFCRLCLEKEIEICKVIFSSIFSDRFFHFFFQPESDQIIQYRTLFTSEHEFIELKMILIAIQLNDETLFQSFFDIAPKNEASIQIIFDYILQLDASNCFEIVKIESYFMHNQEIQTKLALFCKRSIQLGCMQIFKELYHSSALCLAKMKINITREVFESNNTLMLQIIIENAATKTQRNYLLIEFLKMDNIPSLPIINLIWPIVEEFSDQHIFLGHFIKTGYIAAVEFLFVQKKVTSYLDAFICAAKYNRLEFMKWLVLKYGHLFNPLGSYESIIHNTDTLSAAFDKINVYNSLSENTLTEVTKTAHIDVMRYLLSEFDHDETKYPILSNAICSKMNSGNFPVVILFLYYGAKISFSRISSRSMWYHVMFEAAKQKMEVEFAHFFPRSSSITMNILEFFIDSGLLALWFVIP